MTLLDMHGQPAPAFNHRRNQKKAINTLVGMCHGVLADGKVNDDEIMYMRKWLHKNAKFLKSYPLNIVFRRIETILKDGIIDQVERDDLYRMLSDVVGGTFRQIENAGASSTTLPVQQVKHINFQGSAFCFTGRFIFGQRNVCEEAVINKGAVAHKNVTKNLNYLVIGDLASRDWIATTHGTKIQKALDYQESGSPIEVISEESWVQFI